MEEQQREAKPERTGATILAFVGLVCAGFTGGYVAGASHAPHAAAAPVPAPRVAAAVPVRPADRPMAGMAGMSTAPAPVSRSASPIGRTYPAFSFARGEKPLPDGNRLAAYTLDQGVKVFHLTAAKIQWTTVKGNTVTAWAYNGTVPGPEIRVTEGDKVRIVVKNLLAEGTTVHWHGLFVPNDMDGVPMVTQNPIAPGATYTYQFTADPIGTHMYHSHMDDLQQVTSGLYGPFIVEPRHAAAHYTDDFTEVIGDGPLGFIINGKSFPDTAPLIVHQYDTVRIRMINMGDMYHPFHMHGYDFNEIAIDGNPIPPAVQLTMNEIDTAPGGSYDIAFTASRLGTWAFHCHILDHVTGSDGGMGGMITVIKVLPRR